MVEFSVEYFDDVETHRRFAEIFFENVLHGDLSVFSLLLRGDGERRSAESVVFARLYLHENEILSVFCDNIDLPYAGCEIFIEDPVALSFQESCGFSLPGSSQKFFMKVFLCIGHGPISFIALMCFAVP